VGYHSNFVIEMVEKEFGENSNLTVKLSTTREMYKYMEDRGWIRVMNWKSGDFNFVLPARARTPHHQIKAIVDLCIKYNIPIPNDLLASD